MNKQQTACLLRKRGEGRENQEKEKKENTRKKIGKEKEGRNKCQFIRTDLPCRAECSPWIPVKQKRKKKKKKGKRRKKREKKGETHDNTVSELLHRTSAAALTCVKWSEIAQE